MFHQASADSVAAPVLPVASGWCHRPVSERSVVVTGVMAVPKKRPSGWTWRDRWMAFCISWAGIWLFLGIFFWPFWVLVPLSLLAITAPVGRRR